MNSDRRRRDGLRARAVAVAALAMLALVWPAGQPSAWAHPELSASSPAADSTSSEPVDEIELTFSRSVELLGRSVRVLEAEDAVARISRSEDGTVITAVLEPPLGPGTWTVRWRVLAQDAHPREGTFQFTVTGAPSSTAGDGNTAGGSVPVQPSTAVAPAAPPTAYLGATATAARIVLYLGLMVAAGLALFTAWPHRGEQEGAAALAHWTAVGAAAALVGSGVEMAAHVGNVSGDGWSGVTDTVTWGAVLRTGMGWAFWLRTLGLSLLLVGATHRRRNELPSGPDLAKLTGVLLVIASFQFVGHTTSKTPELIVRSSDAVHALAAAVWIGGLVGLAILSRHGAQRGRALAAARFSTIATYAVVAVAVAGTALAVTHLPSLDAASQTTYGRVLLVKIVVVALMGTAGAYNHLRVVPALSDDDDHALDLLRRTVRVEVVLGLVVLILTAVLVGSSPTLP